MDNLPVAGDPLLVPDGREFQLVAAGRVLGWYQVDVLSLDSAADLAEVFKSESVAVGPPLLLPAGARVHSGRSQQPHVMNAQVGKRNDWCSLQRTRSMPLVDSPSAPRASC